MMMVRSDARGLCQLAIALRSSEHTHGFRQSHRKALFLPQAHAFGFSLALGRFGGIVAGRLLDSVGGVASQEATLRADGWVMTIVFVIVMMMIIGLQSCRYDSHVAQQFAGFRLPRLRRVRGFGGCGFRCWHRGVVLGGVGATHGAMKRFGILQKSVA